MIPKLEIYLKRREHLTHFARFSNFCLLGKDKLDSLDGTLELLTSSVVYRHDGRPTENRVKLLGTLVP